LLVQPHQLEETHVVLIFSQVCCPLGTQSRRVQLHCLVNLLPGVSVQPLPAAFDTEVVMARACGSDGTE
jgi:hypothetical protein